MFASNYPEGVTGAERQIAGGPYYQPVLVECVGCKQRATVSQPDDRPFRPVVCQECNDEFMEEVTKCKAQST